MSGPIVSLTDVERRFASTRGRAQGFVLGPLSLELEAGTLTVLQGPSGAGKTTLLHLVAGLDRVDAGVVRWLGTDVTRASEGALASLRRAFVGVASQRPRFAEHLAVWRNVSQRFVPAGMPAAERRELARRELAPLGVAFALDERCSRLSGGEQQRVALARALAGAPRLLVVDEPTASADPETAALLVARLAACRAGGAAVLASSHDPALHRAADRVLALEDGRLRA